VLIVVGPSTHPPGTHEVAAGGRLLKHCLEALEKPEQLKAEVVTEWPADGDKVFADVASVVFIGDMFPPEVMPNRDTIMKHLGAMMKRGCGLVCIHYATGLEAKHVTKEGDHPLLHWMGGYFATRCTHHKSVARVFKEATIEPTRADHPVLRGWKTFTLHDEPYINNYFGADGPDKTVTALATAQLPPEKPNRETVAWAVSRPDGGRGVGVVMPHFYRNWQLDDLRTLILNALVWTAKRDVPRDGVRIKLPDLATFKPAAVEPPKKK
jgi:type 1 glutamine amidotransferase